MTFRDRIVVREIDARALVLQKEFAFLCILKII
jgi:hypothetical protein